MCHRLANVVLVLITVVVPDDYGEGLAIIMYSLVHVDACLQLHLVSFTLSTLFKALIHTKYFISSYRTASGMVYCRQGRLLQLK